MKRAIWAVLALTVLSAGGCAAMGPGGWEEILGGMGGMGGNGGTVRGEIEWVDARGQQLEMRAAFGQRTRLFVDSRTQVVYRGQRQSLGSLSSGDRVVVLVERGGRQREAYARQITVEQWVRDGGRDGDWEQARTDRFDGTVGWIRVEDGQFQLRTSRGSYLVTLPYNASRSTVDRFRRLRAGNGVRIEGELLGNGRIELVTFL